MSFLGLFCFNMLSFILIAMPLREILPSLRSVRRRPQQSCALLPSPKNRRKKQKHCKELKTAYKHLECTEPFEHIGKRC